MLSFRYFQKKAHKLLRLLGPGLITGAADDDPSGIATYSQAGAAFGLKSLWTGFFFLPLMTAVQEACARIGIVTGRGLSGAVRRHYRREVLYTVVMLVTVANTINIGADIGAMAEVTQLVLPLPAWLLLLFYTGLILGIQLLTSYKKYAHVLKWFSLTLLCYPFTLMLVPIDWGAVLRATLFPSFEFSTEFLFVIVGLLGTTISPYMFFWEAAEEVEEEREKHLIIHDKPHITWPYIRMMRWDNALGMLFSQITAWSIMLVSAAVLHSHGITNIGTAADAARALEPLVSSFANAGFLAKLIFATGVVGLGMLSVSVLSGSASYAVSEAFHWRASMNYRVMRARGFYAIIVLSTCVGLFINFIGVDPIKMLLYTAMINGIVSVPLLFLIARISSSKEIMGHYRSGVFSKLLVWIAFSVVLAASLLFFASFFIK